MIFFVGFDGLAGILKVSHMIFFLGFDGPAAILPWFHMSNW